MIKQISIILISLFIFSCASSEPVSKRMGTGRPYMSKISLFGINYTLIPDEKVYTAKESVSMKLIVENTTNRPFVIEPADERFLAVIIKSSKREYIEKHIINRWGIIDTKKFTVPANSKHEFNVSFTPSIKTADEDDINVTIALLFLDKAYRRTTLSVYLTNEGK